MELIIVIAAAVGAYHLAKSKGRNAWGWAIGCGLFPIAIIVLAFLGNEGERKAEQTASLSEQQTAEEAIMASGNQELINQLLLAKATGQSVRGGAAPTRTSNDSSLKTAGAVAGGVLAANAVSSAMHVAAVESVMDEAAASLEGVDSFAEVGVDAGEAGEGVDELLESLFSS
ncbi:hypothetical protein NOR51B_450 [Luminiphilus syltensis NOR5-1B]|uniref:Uncharacterized protein n=1 Tax=Luminiphilus syltensis NOR5-1B TaxID=565045 RepID=B8KVS3_9GAMM|nr:hypothetical protein [Luminiphilus syltensis]EED34513.1 hypothetical protein NOR51B_450 [Luminiphilus syltensis NOR5-1B]